MNPERGERSPLIERFEANSRYTRESQNGTELLESPEGEKLRLDRLTNPEDPRVKGSHDLLKKTFGTSEVDSLATIKTAIEAKVVGDETEEDTPLLVHALTKEGGSEVIGTTHSAVLENLDAKFEGSEGKGFLITAYLAVKEAEQGKGLGRELMRKTLDDAIKHAQERGIQLDGIVAEMDDPETEAFWNKLGLKRLFYENDKGQLVEVPYFQSVLADAWDKRTSMRLVLADLNERSEISSEEVLAKVRAVMNYDSYQTEGYFKKPAAFEQHKAILDRDLEELSAALTQTKNSQVKLYTAADIAEWREQFGKSSVIEHQIEA